MQQLSVPITSNQIDALHVGDMVTISGAILTGRDAALPRLCRMVDDGSIEQSNIALEGGVVFHTAVSPAGVGPTSSNKVEIEGSFETLSSAGVRVHLGKGAIGLDTVKRLADHHACYAITPPVTALFGDMTISKEIVAFPELGMEAVHKLEAVGYPAIIAAVNGESLFENENDR